MIPDQTADHPAPGMPPPEACALVSPLVRALEARPGLRAGRPARCGGCGAQLTAAAARMVTIRSLTRQPSPRQVVVCRACARLLTDTEKTDAT